MADDLRATYKQRFEQDLEPERYEIFALLEELTPDRREFLMALGGGLLFLVTVRAQDRELPVRVQVADDGTFRAFTGKMDMGQGCRTLLTQAFAEELRVPVDKVELVMGDTLLCPDDGGTWASATTPQTVPVIRKAAAAVRAMRIGGDDALSAAGAWQSLGRSVPAITGADIVTGAKRYPSDHRMPEMLHAVVVRGPHHRCTLASYDGAAAAQVPGVRVLRDGDLLAAVAPDLVTARRAAALVGAEWTPEALSLQDDWPAQFRKTAVAPVEQPRARYPPLLLRGDVTAGLAAAVQRLSSSYWLHPIAHVPLEPRAAVASWKDDTVTIHCGVQAPFLVRQEVAQALRIRESQVRIVVLDAGGAFGGKQRGECEVEAARLSRLAGAPVRVAWTREEEFTCSYTRPAALIDVESGVDATGHVVAMRFANYNGGAAGLAPQYAIPHQYIGFHRAKAEVRQGSYRSLAAVGNNFARESHMDDWAERLKVDPLEFRLRNVEDARLREVIERTATRFGWGKTRSGNGRGVAVSCNLEKEARLAMCVEVEVDDTNVRIVRIVATGDFGAALNPGNLQNQMTGAIIQGVGGALWEKVAFDGAAQRTRHLSQYRVPRLRDIPAIDVQIVDRRQVEPAGAGESPITLPAPALAAALFGATGRRVRSLPLLAPA